jgi:DNA polymerase V
VWGIGRETTLKLSALSIKTVDDLLSAGLGFMRQRFGVHGERLFFELSGIPTSQIRGEDSLKASISSTRSFAHVIHDKALLQSALGHHVAHIAEKLREQSVTASVLSIICAPSRYGAYALRKEGLHRELAFPTSDTVELLRETFVLLDILYDSSIPYKKAGVTVSGIIPEPFVPGRLFGDSGKERQEGMYQTIDSINNRFGKGTIRPGVTLNRGDWQESRKLKSPEYTTQWAHIASVKAI